MWLNDGAGCSGPYWNDQSVLVSVAQPIEKNESVTVMPKAAPSFVWLQELHKPDRAGAILPALLESLLFEVCTVPKDRESQILKSFGFKTGGAGDEKVQGRAGIVEHIASDGAETQRDRFVRLENYVPRSIRIVMDGKFIWVASDESFDLAVELCEVFLCTFYFGARAKAWVGLVSSQVAPSPPGSRLP